MKGCHFAARRTGGRNGEGKESELQYPSKYELYTCCCLRGLIVASLHPRSDGVAKVVMFSVASVCGCVYQRDKLTIENIIVKFSREHDVVKSSDEFKNGCIAMQCGARVVI